MKIITLCGQDSCCPVVKITDEHVEIGEKDNLMSALNIRDGSLDRLRVMEFQVKLTPKDEVIIPPVAIAPKYVYAQPVSREEQP